MPINSRNAGELVPWYLWLNKLLLCIFILVYVFVLHILKGKKSQTNRAKWRSESAAQNLPGDNCVGEGAALPSPQKVKATSEKEKERKAFVESVVTLFSSLLLKKDEKLLNIYQKAPNRTWQHWELFIFGHLYDDCHYCSLFFFFFPLSQIMLSSERSVISCEGHIHTEKYRQLVFSLLWQDMWHACTSEYKCWKVPAVRIILLLRLVYNSHPSWTRHHSGIGSDLKTETIKGSGKQPNKKHRNILQRVLHFGGAGTGRTFLSLTTSHPPSALFGPNVYANTCACVNMSVFLWSG